MTRSVVALALWSSLALAATPATGRADTLTLERAVHQALAQNPELRSAETDVLAARARLTGAGLRSPYNPELELVSGTRAGDGEPVDLEVSLWQEVEVAGQRGHRRAAASALVLGQVARREHLRARVVAATRVAFAQALAARDKARLAEEAIELANRLEEIADRRFEAGAITVLERNFARVRRGQARRGRLAADRELVESLAALKGLLALPAERDVTVVGELEVESDMPAGLPGLLALARERRQDLLALRHAREAVAAELALARAEGRPNLHFGLGWEREGGEEDLRVGVAVALPVFNRNQGGRAEGQADIERAAVELAAAEVAIAQDVESAWHRVRLAVEDRAVFNEEVLAQVEENLDLLLQSLEAGKISLLDLLPLQEELIDLRNEHVDAIVELAVARLTLEMATGSTVLPAAGTETPALRGDPR
jgi:cobalt-zinc-cadmium efflux system outer membrane protein